jgi:flagellar secretion chaperone FliS
MKSERDAMNPYQQYMENSVLTATSLELVTMLYRCALEGIADSRRCLAAGDIEGRVRPVNKAYDAVTELMLSLDYENGGEISRNLAELYGYITHKIILGHATQSDECFAEAARLLGTLLESWQQLNRQGVAAEPQLVAAGGW